MPLIYCTFSVYSSYFGSIERPLPNEGISDFGLVRLSRSIPSGLVLEESLFSLNQKCPDSSVVMNSAPKLAVCRLVRSS